MPSASEVLQIVFSLVPFPFKPLHPQAQGDVNEIILKPCKGFHPLTPLKGFHPLRIPLLPCFARQGKNN